MILKKGRSMECAGKGGRGIELADVLIKKELFLFKQMFIYALLQCLMNGIKVLSHRDCAA